LVVFLWIFKSGAYGRLLGYLGGSRTPRTPKQPQITLELNWISGHPYMVWKCSLSSFKCTQDHLNIQLTSGDISVWRSWVTSYHTYDKKWPTRHYLSKTEKLIYSGPWSLFPSNFWQLMWNCL
jgi:hypothetical protein